MTGFHKSFIFLLILFTNIGCIDDEDENLPISPDAFTDDQERSEWLIPAFEVVDGGTARDGIPSIDEPQFIQAEQALVEKDDLVIGFKNGDDIKAYPHNILNWHEIVNDVVGSVPISITFCPLTGTGIGWNREVNGQYTTFGVSGLLYNSNLILYDRLTQSNWSQMRLDAVNGELTGTEIKTHQVVETNWETWQSMYQDTEVLSRNTGYERDYENTPYTNISTNHNLILFPVTNRDGRLLNKKRVYGIIIEDSVKAYALESFGNQTKVVDDHFNDRNIVVVGDTEKNFAVSFYPVLRDSSVLTFTPVQNELPVIMKDNQGNSWDIFGKAVEGPDKGEKLSSPDGYIGYWYAWTAFYPNLNLWNP